jgi:RNA polymerase sigma-70 factor (sigma-E family)
MNTGELAIGGQRLGVFQPSSERLTQLGAWFHAESPSLLRFAYFVSGDSGTAEDLVQDAFVRLYRSSGRVGDATFKAYARKTILNLARSGFVRSARERHAFEAPSHVEPADVGARDEMWAALKTLSPKQRAVVALRYYEDMSESEVAGVLEMSVGSVKKHTDRAMAKLRAQLGDRRQS